MIKQIKKYFCDEILTKRKLRDSTLLFITQDFSLTNLIILLKFELTNEIVNADNLLINMILDDLQKKKILKSEPANYLTYNLSNFIYHDVILKTIDNNTYYRGTATSKTTAFAKAFGEVFERTASKYSSQNEVIYNSPFKQYDLFPRPTKLQIDTFPNFKILPEDIFSQVKVQKINGDECVLPAQYIYFGNVNNKEKKLIESSTHGTGAGYDKQQAFQSGLFEIIHRHFFLKSWYMKKSPNKINLNSLDKNSVLYKKCKDFEERGFNMFFLNYSNEAKCPTIVCIIEKQGGWYCGGSTNLKIYNACERALDEAFSTYLWSMKVMLSGQYKVNEENLKNIKSDFLDINATDFNKVLWFSDSYFIDSFDTFILKGEETDITCDNDIDNVINNHINLKEFAKEIFGEEIFLKEFESKILNSYNYNVAKVIIPKSYFFSLTEIYSRPITNDNTEIVFSDINPFP